MALGQSGTPATPATTTAGTGTVTVTGAWGTGQNRATGNLLVALVTAFGSTSASLLTQHSGTTGWTAQYQSANALCRAEIWTKTAAGTDAAPAFDSTIGGTSARTRLSCMLIELNDPATTTPVVDTGNPATGTSGTLTVTTAGNVAAAGEYAVGVECATSGASAANTWATSGSWTQSFTDGATAYSHWVNAIQAAPASGGTLAYAPTHTITSTQEGGAVAVFKQGVLSAAPSAIIYQATTAQPHPTVLATSPGLELSGFGTFTGVGSSDTIINVIVAANAFASDAGMAAPVYELWDGASSRIGAAQAGAASTSNAHTDTLTFTGVSYSQLATLRVRVYAHSGTALTLAVQYVDWVSLTVNYVSTGARPDATIYAATAGQPAPAVSSSSAVTAPALRAVTAVFPAPVVRQDQAPAATIRAITAGLPAPSAAASTVAAPAVLAAPAAQPTVTASASVTVTALALYATPGVFPAPGLGTDAGASPAVSARAAGFPAATVHVPADSPGLELSGFGTFTGIGAADTITSVTVTVNQYATDAGMAAPTCELWDGTSSRIGAAQACAASTASAHTDTLTFTGVTYAQLATLRVRIYAHSGTASSGAVLNVDYVSLTVAYVPGGAATTIRAVTAAFPAVTVTASSGATATASLYAVSGTYPAPTVRLDQAPAATMAARTAVFPVVTAGGAAAAPATLYAAGTTGFPAATATGGAIAPAALYATTAVSQFDPTGSSASIQLIADAAYAIAAVFPAAAVSTTTNAAPAASLRAVTAAQPAPAVTAATTVTLAVAAAPAAQPAPGTSASSTVTAPALYAVSGVFPAQTAAGGTAVTATAALYATTGVFPAPVTRQDAAPVAVIRATAAVQPAAGVSAGGGVTVTPAALTTAPAFPAPVVRQDQAPAAGLYATTVTAWAVTVAQAITATAALYATTGVFPAATASGNAAATATIRAALAVFPPLAGLSAGMTAAPAALAAPAGFPDVEMLTQIVVATAYAAVTARCTSSSTVTGAVSAATVR